MSSALRMNYMKSLGAVLALALALHPACGAARTGPELGETAPDVRLPFLDGTERQLNEWLGKKPIYLKMWATWCGTCRKEMPHFRDAYERYGSDIAFLSVNAGFNDTIPEVRAFNDEYGLQMPSVIDRSGSIGQAFDFVATPYHVLIDGDGRIVHLGHAADEAVDRLLRRLADEGAGQQVNPARAASAGRQAADFGVPMIGDPAPTFSITTLSGSTFSVNRDTGGEEPVYLLFFTTWCESYLAGEGEDEITANACRETRQTIGSAIENADDPPQVVGIASRMWTGSRELREYASSVEISYPVALDETNEIFRRYGVRRFPTLIVISEGRIHGRYEGAVTSLPDRP